MRAFFRLPDSGCYIAAGVRDADSRSTRGSSSGQPLIRVHRRRMVANASVLLGTLFGQALLARRLDPSPLTSRKSAGSAPLELRRSFPAPPLAGGERVCERVCYWAHSSMGYRLRGDPGRLASHKFPAAAWLKLAATPRVTLATMR
jgi:hypothetical protein